MQWMGLPFRVMGQDITGIYGSEVVRHCRTLLGTCTTEAEARSVSPRTLKRLEHTLFMTYKFKH